MTPRCGPSADTHMVCGSGCMCAPSAEDPREECPPPTPPPLPPVCIFILSIKFFPIARTDGFRLCLGDGLSATDSECCTTGDDGGSIVGCGSDVRECDGGGSAG
jgi:hypothetical protein